MRWFIVGVAVAALGRASGDRDTPKVWVRCHDQALDGKGQLDKVHSKWRTASLTGKDSKR